MSIMNVITCIFLNLFKIVPLDHNFRYNQIILYGKGPKIKGKFEK